MNKVRAIEKILSRNDLGLNGSHQSGILIPKSGELLSFFPALDKNAVNPRAVIYFTDEAAQKWKFNFIYYNNKLRGGTRNEYRLTEMTAFFRNANLKAGDSLIFTCEDNDYSIQYKRQGAVSETNSDNIVKLILNSEWRVFNF